MIKIKISYHQGIKNLFKIFKINAFIQQTFVNEEDIVAVVKVLKSKTLTKGKIIEFENKISKFVKSKYAIAVSSASAALHLSCMALQLKMKFSGQF